MTAIRLLLPLILIGVMVFSVVDIITIVESRVRHLPKMAWIFIVVALSFVGSLLWFLVGREPMEQGETGRYSSPSRAGGRGSRGGPLAPDDDPDFLARLRREREQEERIKKLEERLGDLDDDKSE